MEQRQSLYSVNDSSKLNVCVQLQTRHFVRQFLLCKKKIAVDTLFVAQHL
jgi:hypothetical protein